MVRTTNPHPYFFPGRHDMKKSNQAKRSEHAKSRGSKSKKTEVSKLRQEVKKLAKKEETPVGVAASYAGKAQNHIPKVHMERGATVVSHTELVEAYAGRSGWTPESLVLQPGIAATFPWLSQIAPSYEQYRFRKLSFKFMTSVGTSTSGNVYMIPDYDAGDSSPPDEAKGMNNQKAKGGVPWQNYAIHLSSSDLHPNGKRKFTRHAGLSAYSDIRAFDCGQVFLCSTGCTESAIVGRVFVEYEIELYVPQYDTTITALAMAGGVSRLVNLNLVDSTPTGKLFDWITTSTLGTKEEYPLGSGAILSQYRNSTESVGGSGNYVFLHNLVVGMAYKFLVRIAVLSGGGTSFTGLTFDGASSGITTAYNLMATWVSNYGIIEMIFTATESEGYFVSTWAGIANAGVVYALDVMLIQVPAALAAVTAGQLQWAAVTDEKPNPTYLCNGVSRPIKCLSADQLEYGRRLCRLDRERPLAKR